MHDHRLPQLERTFLTDGGLETDLIFNRGVDLRCFASIALLRHEHGTNLLKDYFRPYMDIATRSAAGFILESASWRGSPDWGPKLDLTQDELDALNVRSVEMLHDLRGEYASSGLAVVVSACIGPRGDGYDPGAIMSMAEAREYHLHQARVLAAATPDMLSAMTMNNVPEAIAIVEAARTTGLPVAISFTLETDGRLPTGDALAAAIDDVDRATAAYASYFMINCAHPSHFVDALASAGTSAQRVRGIRANASRCSHAELDAMDQLDDGDPQELAQLYRHLRARFPQLTVLGGCCGTDLRHVEAIAAACLGELVWGSLVGRLPVPKLESSGAGA